MWRDHRGPQLAITAASGGDGLHIRVSGEIDMAVADQLLDTVLAHLPRHGDTLILDFAEVTFCDSAGLNALIRLRHHQAAAGHTLHVINTAPPVRRALEVGGLIEYLNVDSPPVAAETGLPTAEAPGQAPSPIPGS